MFYTVYSIPNMFLPLFGGIILDKIGISLGLVSFCLILSLGQLVFAIGGYRESYVILLLGRILFGLGGECMSVA